MAISNSHRHAQNMLAYAQDALLTTAPWRLWQSRRSDSEPWQDCQQNPGWESDCEYRRVVPPPNYIHPDYTDLGSRLVKFIERYQVRARRCGRTTFLLDHLRDGDRVVVPSPEQVPAMEKLILERGLNVKVIAFSPRNRVDEVREKGMSEGRTLFDHTWTEMYYSNAIREAYSALMQSHSNSSKWSDDHELRREQALLLKKLGRLPSGFNPLNGRFFSHSAEFDEMEPRP